MSHRTMSRKTKNVLVTILSVILALTAACSCWFAYKYFEEESEYQKQEEIMTDIRLKAEGNLSLSAMDSSIIHTETESPEDPMYRYIDFDELLGINPDITRWVYIPDSTLDYPVLQERTVGEYRYIWSDIYGNYSGTGTPFSPAIPLDIDDPHILLFGHTFAYDRDTMFYVVKKYFDREYFDTHPYAYVYYSDRTEKWLVVESRNVYSWDEVYDLPYSYGSEDYAELQQHLFADYRQQLTEHITDITSDDPLLILSTCDRQFDYDNGRRILICRLAEVLDRETGVVTQVYDDSRQ